MHRPKAKEPRFLLLTAERQQQRAQALAAALGYPQTQFSIAATGSAFPDPAGFDAVIIDGPQEGISSSEVERLVAYVQAGGSVLAIAPLSSTGDGAFARDLLGCQTLEPLPRGEFYGKTVPDSHELLQRVSREFPFLDSFAPLQPVNGSVHSLVKARVRFQDQPVIVEHQLGQGRVVVSALGRSVEALQTPQLHTIFRRALRPRNGRYAEKPLSIAIIGYGPLGGVGYGHGLAINHTPGLCLVAVCDRSDERLKAAALDFPDIRCYASPDEIASDREIEVVFIATPPSTHAELALAMLRAGKHVVCEKPLCLTVAEADSLSQTAEAQGLALTVNQNRRWDPDFLAIQKALESGQLGEVFNFETFVGSFAHPCREWHSETAISGGAEYDWGSHHVDWILLAMKDMPKAVSASGHKRVWYDVTNHDQIRIRMLWEDGREAQFVHSEIAAIRPPKFYVQGSKGTIAGYYRPLISESIQPGRGYVRQELHHAEAPADLTLMLYDSASGGLVEQKLPLPVVEPYAFHRNLADHLHGDDVPLAVSFDSVRRVIAVLEAAHHSAELGGAWLPPPA